MFQGQVINLGIYEEFQPLGGRYLLFISPVRRNINMAVMRLSSAARSRPSAWQPSLAPGCREATIGSSYVRLNADWDPVTSPFETMIYVTVNGI